MVSLRLPPEDGVPTTLAGFESLRVFLYKRGNPSQLLLRLDFGSRALHVSMMPATRNLPGGPRDVFIGAYRAERCGPGWNAAGAFSEGVLDLGGEEPLTRVHFCYAGLDPQEQQEAETIIASIRKSR